MADHDYSPEELAAAEAAWQQHQAQSAQFNPPPTEAEANNSVGDYAKSGLDLALRGLDYAGGLTRTGVAKVLGATKEGDVGKAFRGRAPTTAQYMEQAGVPEGAKASDYLPIYGDKDSGAYLEKGGAMDPSVRGVGGFVGDVALDPLTYLSAGLSAAGKAGELGRGAKIASKIANPIEAYEKAAGPRLFDKAFKKVNQFSKETGRPPISEVLRKNGFVGNLNDAVEATQGINKAAGKEIESVLGEASKRGAKINPLTAFDSAIEEAARYKAMPSSKAEALGTKLEDEITHIMTKAQGGMTPSEANELKSFLADTIREAGFSSDVVEKRVDKAIMGDLSKAVKSSVNSEDAELLKRLEEANKTYAATSMPIQDKLSQVAGQVKNSRGAGTPTLVDMMLGGSGLAAAASHNPKQAVQMLGALGAKKVGEAAMSTTGRTARGKLADTIAQKAYGSIDSAARRGILNLRKDSQ